MKLKIQARAKINWTLDVVGTLPNGYHDLDMLMQSVTLCDQMTMEEAPQLTLYVRAQGRSFVPADGNNLVLKAAAALQAATGCARGARITLKKYIPVAAGMGGGSSDAAAYAGNGAEGKLVVGGSSSVSPVMEKLIEAYKAVNANADIELQTTDSTTGMTSAIEGTYDIGMASRELKDDEAAALEHQAIAMDGIAVIVNIANPADDLTVEQVASIFLGDVTKWNEIVK